MLLKLLSTYYHYLWLALAIVICSKTILSFVFNRNLEGFQGFLYAIFKWYNEDDKDMAETNKRRFVMNISNIFSVIIYIILGFIILFSILPMFITH
ncbi:MAG: hypothetical protein KF781_09140 [Chitinophagaceae bacterium]|nr:hypothetical protein [Chitinophagaceae bacterium]MCW5905019.1 hypothetical protein [Chitinophagaceae bacterium]